jgi:hypothetical protein
MATGWISFTVMLVLSPRIAGAEVELRASGIRRRRYVLGCRNHERHFNLQAWPLPSEIAR